MSNRKEKQSRRDHDRMAKHVARKTGHSNADELEEREGASGSTRSVEHPSAKVTRHGSSRKPPPAVSKKEEKSGRPADPATKYVAKEASPPSDELRYNVPSLFQLQPRTDFNLYNHTAEGYLNVIEQCHTKMAKLDNRISRTLPLPVFVHNCTQLYHLHLLKIANETGQNAAWTDAEDDIDVEDLERLLNANSVVMPAEIHDWLKGLGRFKDKTGYEYVPNVPKSVVPKKRRIRHDGGDFGAPTAANHNCYEVSISPQVTKRTVQALLVNQPVNGNIDYTPLPDNLTPGNSVPTPNLLGYRPRLRPLHPETVSNYAQALESWSHTTLASRIGYNPVLWSKQNAALTTLGDKMELRTGMPDTDKGSLAIYGTIVYEAEEAEATLRLTSGILESAADLDPGSIAGAVLKTYRRRRTAQAPGYCYLGVGNAPLPNWLGNINNSYDMQAPFNPTYGVVDLTLNSQRFRRVISEGRYDMILEELTRLTLKKR